MIQKDKQICSVCGGSTFSAIKKTKNYQKCNNCGNIMQFGNPLQDATTDLVNEKLKGTDKSNEDEKTKKV